MAYESITTKKFLNSDGVGHLWTRIRQRYDSKLDSVAAANDSISVANNNQISVVISAESDNILQLKTTGNKGLYVSGSGITEPTDTYAITKDEESSTYSAVYRLKRYAGGTGAGVDAGVSINIPKDMVVQSGTVVTKTVSGVWGEAGTYIELTLANANNQKLYIPVGSLIEYVTSGSAQGDMVYVTVNPETHQITATITDGTVTKAKLASAVQASLDLADSSVQSISEGSANGTISVDGVNISVHGLGSAAYTATTDYDTAGAAAAVLGTSSDSASTRTVYGSIQYASDVYASIQSLTTSEINGAIAVANSEIDG